MLKERRDFKGRKLNQGESQRPDGRYDYRYVDSEGRRRSLYSWKLVESDKTPKGKIDCPALRTLEKEILRDEVDGIDRYSADSLTFNDCFDEYMCLKVGLKQSTRVNYLYMYDKYVRQTLGRRLLGEIKYTTVKRFYLSLINTGNFKVNSLDNIHTIVHPVFDLAVKEGLIRFNPTDGLMKEIKMSVKCERDKRHALTIEQQEALVDFLSSDKKYSRWKTILTVMLGTGARVGEVVGLTWSDCDFKEDVISINHSLIYRPQDDGHCEFRVTTPKTASGIREIPMLEQVKSTLLSEWNRQMAENRFCKDEVDGFSGFIFMNRYGQPLSPHNINRAIERIIKEYNDLERTKALQENRPPVILPHFSAHNLRHTFCTRFCENETNLKVIQEIMGHSDITTTMNIYNEATKDSKVKSFENLGQKIKIG